MNKENKENACGCLSLILWSNIHVSNSITCLMKSKNKLMSVNVMLC